MTRACVPHLRQGDNPHILTLSPPISLEPRWLGPHIGYTLAKYGMSLCALGFAAELRDAGVASNTLWPRTLIATAAVQNLLGGDEAMKRSRKPELYSDAAYAVITRPSRECTGNSYLCEDVLAEEGITDMDRYAYVEGSDAAGRSVRRSHLRAAICAAHRASCRRLDDVVQHAGGDDLAVPARQPRHRGGGRRNHRDHGRSRARPLRAHPSDPRCDQPERLPHGRSAQGTR